MVDERVGWIKLYRKILDSEMYQSLNAKQKVVMITCLLLANHKPQKCEWNGEIHEIKAGQFITSLESLKKHCGKDISIRNVRTALSKLEKWRFLTSKSTNTGRLITILNWHFYQDSTEKIDKEIDRQVTNSRQASGKGVTTNNNIIRMNKNDKENKFNDLNVDKFLYHG
ncbi:MAG: hypothetical protein IMW83_03175 [Caldanaerobacter subterraneus]|nr:hypothetical protein [Caldanaerobacter subterraneus]